MNDKRPDGISDRACEYIKSAQEREAKTKEAAAIAYEQSAAGRHERILKEIATDTKSLDELKRIADAAEKRAVLAEKEAKSAKKDARFSKIVSIISIVITLISILVEHLL